MMYTLKFSSDLFILTILISFSYILSSLPGGPGMALVIGGIIGVVVGGLPVGGFSRVDVVVHLRGLPLQRPAGLAQ